MTTEDAIQEVERTARTDLPSLILAIFTIRQKGQAPGLDVKVLGDKVRSRRHRVERLALPRRPRRLASLATGRASREQSRSFSAARG